MNGNPDWKKKVENPEQVVKKIEPGMSLFIGTGNAEPRTLVKHLMESDSSNIQDLELIQLISLGDAISLKELTTSKYRLKTFYSGWVASQAITAGRVDLIPCHFSRVPELIQSRQISIDAAFIQITPPNEAGYSSLGVAVDVARQAMEQARLVVGEINPKVPYTLGDTFVHISDFDMLVESAYDPIYFERWPVDKVFDQVALNVASVIEDTACIGFTIGPLYEALAPHLARKRHLGVHSPFVTDALMDLIKSGAVTNRYKELFRGKSLTSYASGTKALYEWLNRNPMVEFQSIDRVFNPVQIGKNPRFMAIFPARKVDISGKIVLHTGKGNVTANAAETLNFINGAELSSGGRTIFALPSRNLKGEPNIRCTVENYPNQFFLKESVDMVVTEYGVANLFGRTVRERAQALIDIAHPDDRPTLVEKAKKDRVLYQDQIYLAESAHLYPVDAAAKETFKNDLTVRFRAIRPSDEEEMRRLFYRFSDKAVYYRYFSPIKTMPHAKMQEYVNIDYSRVMSIVGLIGDPGRGRIIAEGRFIRDRQAPYADVAFVVDEEYQGYGIATYMYKFLIRLAKERGVKGFKADVLASNKAMMKVFEKGGKQMRAQLDQGVYEILIPFGDSALNIQ